MSYESETGDPVTPQCKCRDRDREMKLTFDGWYLRLWVGGQIDSAQHARSGTSNGQDPKNAFDYSQVRQQSKGGPIPEGNYWIQPNELRLPGFLDFSEDHQRSWGNYRITIHHPPQTNTFGRGGFFIHGGAKFGSIGCIDLAGFMDHFVARLRDLLPTVRIQTYGGGGPGSAYERGAGRLEFATACHVPLTVQYGSVTADMPPWFNT